MRGLGLGFTDVASTFGGFSPASLAPNAWYDPSDLSSMFQDTAGTTPITADGQAVARINDKSGNGYHLTQATAGSRALYKTSGGLSWLLFDGVDDGYTQAAVTFPASADFAYAFFNSGAAVNYLPVDSAATVLVGVCQSGNGSTTSTAAGFSDFVNGAAVVPDTRDGLFLAMGSAAPKVFQSQGGTLATFTNLRLSSFGGFLLSGRMYGMIITPALSAANRAKQLTWLGAKAGLVL
jgi:hypothetical protein